MKNKYLNGLLMAILSLLATIITTTGMPKTTPEWEVLGVIVIGTVLTYTAKNAIFPSISLFGTIDLSDLGSGLFLALGTGLSSWAADVVTSAPINWHDLLSLCGTIFVTYLAKKILSYQQGVKTDLQVLKETKTKLSK